MESNLGQESGFLRAHLEPEPTECDLALGGSVLALLLILLSLHKETVSFHEKDQEQVVNMKLSVLSSPMYLSLFLGFSLSPLPGIHNSCQDIFVHE